MTTSIDDGDLRRLEQAPPLRVPVHEKLERLISNGNLRPGARLVESELAQTLGVSRGPIREALQQLAHDGFVDLRPRLGAFVHVPEPAEVDDFFDVRRALEGEAAALAARRITEASAERIRAAIHQGRSLLEEGKDPSAAPRSISFHNVITQVANNPLLSQMLALVGKRSSWYLSAFDLGRRRRTWDEHELIASAVLTGSPEAARASAIAHIEGARDHYKKARWVEPTTSATP